MAERMRFQNFTNGEPKEPIDVNLAKKAKGLGVVQGGIGLGFGVFINPVLGGAMIAYEATQWVALNRYVQWREKKPSKAQAEALPKAA